MLRVRPRVPDSRRRGRRLQGALHSRRAAACAVGIRRRRAVRSDREEAVLPRASRRAGLQLRDARLRSALRLLPELGDVAGAARSPGGRAAARRDRRQRSSRDAVALGARVVVSTYNEPLITSEWAVAIFKEARAAGLVTGVRVERQRHARGCSITSGRGSICTRSISRASTTGTIASSAGGSSRSSRPSRAAREGHLARDRDAADSGIQRFAGRTGAPDGVHRGRLAATFRGTSRHSTRTTG